MQFTEAAKSSRKEETGCIGWNMTAMKLYISDARFKPCVVFFISRVRAISELNDKIILKTVVWILFYIGTTMYLCIVTNVF